MTTTLVKLRGEKVARRVIGRATRETERALAKGQISPEVYRVRMARIDAERKACGL